MGGSIFDAFKALKPHNIGSTVGALSRNLSLAVMLLTDVFKSGAGKLHDIRHYYPEADPDDWVFIPAGVRAQIIKKDPKTGMGMLQFGTEVAKWAPKIKTMIPTWSADGPAGDMAKVTPQVVDQIYKNTGDALHIFPK